MAKIAKILEVAVADLVPYERNAKRHDPEQVEKIAASIKEFGFLAPCLIDKGRNIIAGHGRVMAAKQIGLEKVPCVFIEGLTEAQRRAYILADNRLTELGGWNMETVNAELGALADLNFDINLIGFEVSNDWFQNRNRNDKSTEGESDSYAEFVEKFEQKKTTDDCYTPDVVYDAVAEWTAKEYGISREKFVRPFRPGGDYQTQIYPDGCAVVDNPPFSIMSEIVRFYAAHGIKFLLFAPTLTMFTSAVAECCTAIPCGASITYENGANVNTSFLTNLEAPDIAVRSAPDLYAAVSAANSENLKAIHKQQRKYKYPYEVVTAPMVVRFSKYGVPFSFKKTASVLVDALDEQKAQGDGIFGRGFLISEKATAERIKAEKDAAENSAAERAAAERAAAETWKLSEREREIIKGLGAHDN